MREIVQITCEALAHDAYPAGLRLACDLWTEAERADRCPLAFSAIKESWDGVLLTGRLNGRSYGVAINYGTSDVVCLLINARRRLLEGRTAYSAFLASVRSELQALLPRMEGRTRCVHRGNERSAGAMNGPPGE